MTVSATREVATLAVEDGVGIITIDHPPVNALSAAVRRGLDDGFRTFAADPAVRAIVLICAGRTFFAGADITEFGKPLQEPDLAGVFDIIEAGAKPVIAAIHGTALGGGLELALVCHTRVAVPSAKVGLPEVKLGLLPGAGGTQRLPRIVGAAVALDLIGTGRAVTAAEARALGIVDELAAEGELRRDAVALARRLLAGGELPIRVRDRQDRMVQDRAHPEIFADFRRANAGRFRGYEAPENIVKAIEAAVTLPFDEGMRREAELFGELYGSVQASAQQHVFFAEREAFKVPDVPTTTPPRRVASVGVIGAGTMGGGIAMSFADAGVPVRLLDMGEESLRRGLATIGRNYDASVGRGRLSPAQAKERMELITPASSLHDLASTDLVIEAVFESMPVKKDLFAQLDRIARPDAILATNTSMLDVDEIASATADPSRVVGLHFFSPANVMRLLEVVRGRATSKDVIATAMKVAKQIGKNPVLSNVGHGFIANRLMGPRMRQAEALLLEGATPQAVDDAIYEYGFPMGPFRMMDLVGLDVIGRDSNERSLYGDFLAGDRLGQKNGRGFYDYDDQRRATRSSAALELIAGFARHRGVSRKDAAPAGTMLARMLYPVVNEGSRILEEGIAQRASDVDLAAILGYGWPAYTGGPMFWADTVGLNTIVEALRGMSDMGPDFAPSDLLVRLAADGGRFTT